jgi:hypothetical protein
LTTTPILRRADAGDTTLTFAQETGILSSMINGSHEVTWSHFLANRNTMNPNYKLVLEDEVAETVEFEPLPDPLLPPLLLPPFFF